jgi:hypothetical protein
MPPSRRSFKTSSGWRSPNSRTGPPKAQGRCSFEQRPRVSSVSQPVGATPRGCRPRFMQSEERLLPAEAIRRDHVTANEITRHRITSFQFVEHESQCGSKCPEVQGVACRSVNAGGIRATAVPASRGGERSRLSPCFASLWWPAAERGGAGTGIWMQQKEPRGWSARSPRR